MSNSTVVLPSLYYGPVQAYAHLIKAEKAIIEINDHYSRRTYRNRTTILAAHGPMDLTIPVIKPKGKTKTKEIKISYDINWQKNHWKSIESAYNNSPFFEYYKFDLEPVYNNKWEHLAGLNKNLLTLVLEMLEVDINVEYSENYIDKTIDEDTDLRDIIYPSKNKKESDFLNKLPPYKQVFSENMNFVPNMSILDLIFNKGPESYSYLESIP
ncbi:MAG: WbqC family protein [Chlorobi bacterium]|nr:WbqC family protein [Chlorobiota bacterium]